MERFEATLAVREIRGKHGPFNVGTLQTSIGHFKIKDKELDQYVPGTYSGVFLVEAIYTKSVSWNGGTFTELLARIAEGGYLIDDEDHTPAAQVPPPVEADPADDEVPALATNQKVPANAGALNDDHALFGIELFPLVEQLATPIALDPSVDRIQFRRQRERLKELGYRFNAKEQNWLRD